MIAALSTLYSTLPALISLIASATSKVTVPDLGFGIKPLGPKTLPILPTTPIMSGDATMISKSNHPPWIFSINSSPPTKSAPAASASATLSPLVITTILVTLPVPCGSTTAPLTCWSACLGSTPSLTANSTVSSKFAFEVFSTKSKASVTSYKLFLSTNFKLSLYFLPLFGII